ncbi:DUF397 domain-containing protein [Streptomyces sp. UNOC14_S4]|uniref:DUF397 domain-containing protein n=1 Tax=Streptomyces sp. UNOC14_S4 TaxID=2872340 RepID=UPI001E329B89|nr:DUF397 domain-containing protein [Streptomyces sp. UNOC14_S4]MCC3767066.1 DUF397 domain-containing protein [Streptomyces sp. UNOC14_S4]
MHTRPWQKSSYSGNAGNCLHIAADAPDTVRLRESDIPDLILTTSRAALRNLIRTVKADRLSGQVDN